MRPADNPFRSKICESLEFECGGSSLSCEIERFWDDLRANRYRGAIIGGHGRGKSTFLDALYRHSRAQSFPVARHTMRDETLLLERLSILSKIFHDSLSLHFLDGYEQLSLFERALIVVLTVVFHRRLLVTSHKTTFLPSLRYFESNPQLFRKLFIRALEVSGRENSEISMLLSNERVQRALDQIFAQAEGDIRQGFRKLYDEFASGLSNAEVTRVY